MPRDGVVGDVPADFELEHRQQTIVRRAEPLLLVICPQRVIAGLCAQEPAVAQYSPKCQARCSRSGCGSCGSCLPSRQSRTWMFQPAASTTCPRMDSWSVRQLLLRLPSVGEGTDDGRRQGTEGSEGAKGAAALTHQVEHRFGAQVQVAPAVALWPHQVLVHPLQLLALEERLCARRGLSATEEAEAERKAERRAEQRRGTKGAHR